MPKTFYTERDIDDLVSRGVTSLIVDDDVVLTDMAYEKARELHMQLLRENDKPPAAPVRPYIAKTPSPAASTGANKPVIATPTPTISSAANSAGGDDLHQRVYKAALARLGNSVDPKLLDTIVQRVLKSIATK